MLSLHRWSIFTVRVHLFLICGTVLTVGKMYYYHISSTFWRKSNRCSPPQVLLWKGVLKIYSKDTGEQLQIDFIDITLCHGSSPVNFLHISRISLFKNTSDGLLLKKKKAVAKQLNWNHTSAWVHSCKIAAYFQNTFSWEYLWGAASKAKESYNGIPWIFTGLHILPSFLIRD